MTRDRRESWRSLWDWVVDREGRFGVAGGFVRRSLERRSSGLGSHMCSLTMCPMRIFRARLGRRRIQERRYVKLGCWAFGEARRIRRHLA